MTTPNLRKKPFHANSSLQALAAIGVAIAPGNRIGWRGTEKQTRGEGNRKFAWMQFLAATGLLATLARAEKPERGTIRDDERLSPHALDLGMEVASAERPARWPR